MMNISCMLICLPHIKDSMAFAFLAISSRSHKNKEFRRTLLIHGFFFDRSRGKKASFQYYLCASIPLLVFMRMLRYIFFLKPGGHGSGAKWGDTMKELSMDI